MSIFIVISPKECMHKSIYKGPKTEPCGTQTFTCNGMSYTSIHKKNHIYRKNKSLHKKIQRGDVIIIKQYNKKRYLLCKLVCKIFIKQALRPQRGQLSGHWTVFSKGKWFGFSHCALSETSLLLSVIWHSSWETRNKHPLSTAARLTLLSLSWTHNHHRDQRTLSPGWRCWTSKVIKCMDNKNGIIVKNESVLFAFCNQYLSQNAVKHNISTVFVRKHKQEA